MEDKKFKEVQKCGYRSRKEGRYQSHYNEHSEHSLTQDSSLQPNIKHNQLNQSIIRITFEVHTLYNS